MTPIKSPAFDNVRGKALTDKRITEYIRQGRYGPALQAEQKKWDRKAAALKEENKPKKMKRKQQISDLI